MAPSKGPYKSSRPATSRATLGRAPLMVTPQRRAAPVTTFPRIHSSPSGSYSPRTPIKRLGSPYHTPSTPTPPYTPPGQVGHLRPSHPLRSSRSRLGRQCVLDERAHPYLIARIMEWSDPAVLRAFRATSSRYLRRADVLLSHHLLIAATEADGEGELAAEICPLRPSEDGLYVPHGRHPALRHLFAPASALSTTTPANGAYGFFHHDPGTVSDLRIAVRQASAVQAVLESTEVVDVAGRLSTPTMRQLRASAVNAQLYRLHLDKGNTHLLGEFDQGKRVTLSLHLDSGVAATPVPARGMGAVRRLILNVPTTGKEPFVPPPYTASSATDAGQLEVVIVPSTAFLEGLDPDRALLSIRTAYASAISFAVSLCPSSTPTCLGLDAEAYTLLGISDHEVEYLLRLEISRLESILLDSLPAEQHDAVRRALASVRFSPRQAYVNRIGSAHFALETNPTWFGGNEMTHAADESYNDSFSVIEGNSAVVLGGALEHILQHVHGHVPPAPPVSTPGKRVVSASPSFVVVDTPEGSEHYFPAPRRRLTRPATRHRKRNSLCVLM